MEKGREAASGVENGRDPLCGEIPIGWTRKIYQRSTGKNAGQRFVEFRSPEKKRIRSKTKLKEYIEESGAAIDVSLFEFRADNNHETECPRSKTPGLDHAPKRGKKTAAKKNVLNTPEIDTLSTTKEKITPKKTVPTKKSASKGLLVTLDKLNASPTVDRLVMKTPENLQKKTGRIVKRRLSKTYSYGFYRGCRVRRCVISSLREVNVELVDIVISLRRTGRSNLSCASTVNTALVMENLNQDAAYYHLEPSFNSLRSNQKNMIETGCKSVDTLVSEGMDSSYVENRSVENYITLSHSGGNEELEEGKHCVLNVSAVVNEGSHPSSSIVKQTEDDSEREQSFCSQWSSAYDNIELYEEKSTPTDRPASELSSMDNIFQQVAKTTEENTAVDDKLNEGSKPGRKMTPSTSTAHLNEVKEDPEHEYSLDSQWSIDYTDDVVQEKLSPPEDSVCASEEYFQQAQETIGGAQEVSEGNLSGDSMKVDFSHVMNAPVTYVDTIRDGERKVTTVIMNSPDEFTIPNSVITSSLCSPPGKRSPVSSDSAVFVCDIPTTPKTITSKRSKIYPKRGKPPKLKSLMINGKAVPWRANFQDLSSAVETYEKLTGENLSPRIRITKIACRTEKEMPGVVEENIKDDANNNCFTPDHPEVVDPSYSNADKSFTDMLAGEFLDLPLASSNLPQLQVSSFDFCLSPNLSPNSPLSLSPENLLFESVGVACHSNNESASSVSECLDTSVSQLATESSSSQYISLQLQQQETGTIIHTQPPIPISTSEAVSNHRAVNSSSSQPSLPSRHSPARTKKMRSSRTAGKSVNHQSNTDNFLGISNEEEFIPDYEEENPYCDGSNQDEEGYGSDISVGSISTHHGSEGEMPGDKDLEEGEIIDADDSALLEQNLSSPTQIIDLVTPSPSPIRSSTASKDMKLAAYPSQHGGEKVGVQLSISPLCYSVRQKLLSGKKKTSTETAGHEVSETKTGKKQSLNLLQGFLTKFVSSMTDTRSAKSAKSLPETETNVPAVVLKRNVSPENSGFTDNVSAKEDASLYCREGTGQRDEVETSLCVLPSLEASQSSQIVDAAWASEGLCTWNEEGSMPTSQLVLNSVSQEHKESVAAKVDRSAPKVAPKTEATGLFPCSDTNQAALFLTQSPVALSEPQEIHSYASGEDAKSNEKMAEPTQTLPAVSSSWPNDILKGSGKTDREYENTDLSPSSLSVALTGSKCREAKLSTADSKTAASSKKINTEEMTFAGRKPDGSKLYWRNTGKVIMKEGKQQIIRALIIKKPNKKSPGHRKAGKKMVASPLVPKSTSQEVQKPPEKLLSVGSTLQVDRAIESTTNSSPSGMYDAPLSSSTPRGMESTGDDGASDKPILSSEEYQRSLSILHPRVYKTLKVTNRCQAGPVPLEGTHVTPSAPAMSTPTEVIALEQNIGNEMKDESSQENKTSIIVRDQNVCGKTLEHSTIVIECEEDTSPLGSGPDPLQMPILPEAVSLDQPSPSTKEEQKHQDATENIEQDLLSQMEEPVSYYGENQDSLAVNNLLSWANTLDSSSVLASPSQGIGGPHLSSGAIPSHASGLPETVSVDQPIPSKNEGEMSLSVEGQNILTKILQPQCGKALTSTVESETLLAPSKPPTDILSAVSVQVPAVDIEKDMQRNKEEPISYNGEKQTNLAVGKQPSCAKTPDSSSLDKAPVTGTSGPCQSSGAIPPQVPGSSKTVSVDQHRSWDGVKHKGCSVKLVQLPLHAKTLDSLLKSKATPSASKTEDAAVTVVPVNGGVVDHREGHQMKEEPVQCTVENKTSHPVNKQCKSTMGLDSPNIAAEPNAASAKGVCTPVKHKRLKINRKARVVGLDEKPSEGSRRDPQKWVVQIKNKKAGHKKPTKQDPSGNTDQVKESLASTSTVPTTSESKEEQQDKTENCLPQLPEIDEEVLSVQDIAFTQRSEPKDQGKKRPTPRLENEENIVKKTMKTIKSQDMKTHLQNTPTETPPTKEPKLTVKSQSSQQKDCHHVDTKKKKKTDRILTGPTRQTSDELKEPLSKKARNQNSYPKIPNSVLAAWKIPQIKSESTKEEVQITDNLETGEEGSSDEQEMSDRTERERVSFVLNSKDPSAITMERTIQNTEYRAVETEMSTDPPTVSTTTTITTDLKTDYTKEESQKNVRIVKLIQHVADDRNNYVANRIVNFFEPKNNESVKLEEPEPCSHIPVPESCLPQTSLEQCTPGIVTSPQPSPPTQFDLTGEEEHSLVIDISQDTPERSMNAPTTSTYNPSTLAQTEGGSEEWDIDIAGTLSALKTPARSVLGTPTTPSAGVSSPSYTRMLPGTIGQPGRERDADWLSLDAEGHAAIQHCQDPIPDPLAVKQQIRYMTLLKPSPQDSIAARIRMCGEKNNFEKLANVFQKISFHSKWVQYMEAFMAAFCEPSSSMKGVHKKFQIFVQAFEKCLEKELEETHLKALAIIGVHLMVKCREVSEWEEGFLILYYMNERMMDILRAEIPRMQPVSIVQCVVQLCLVVENVSSIKNALETSSWYATNCLTPKTSRMLCCTRICCLKHICFLLANAIRSGLVKSKGSLVACFKLMTEIMLKLLNTNEDDKRTLKNQYSELIVINDVYKALLSLAIEMELTDMCIIMFNLIINFLEVLVPDPGLLRNLILFLYEKRAPTNELFDEAVAIAGFCTMDIVGLYPDQPNVTNKGGVILLWTCLTREEMYLLIHNHLKQVASAGLSSVAQMEIIVVLKQKPPNKHPTLFQEVNSNLRIACSTLEKVLKYDLKPPVAFIGRDGNYQLNMTSVGSFVRALIAAGTHDSGLNIGGLVGTPPTQHFNNKPHQAFSPLKRLAISDGIGNSSQPPAGGSGFNSGGDMRLVQASGSRTDMAMSHDTQWSEGVGASSEVQGGQQQVYLRGPPQVQRSVPLMTNNMALPVINVNQPPPAVFPLPSDTRQNADLNKAGSFPPARFEFDGSRPPLGGGLPLGSAVTDTYHGSLAPGGNIDGNTRNFNYYQPGTTSGYQYRQQWAPQRPQYGGQTTSQTRTAFGGGKMCEPRRPPFMHNQGQQGPACTSSMPWPQSMGSSGNNRPPWFQGAPRHGMRPRPPFQEKRGPRQRFPQASSSMGLNQTVHELCLQMVEKKALHPSQLTEFSYAITQEFMRCHSGQQILYNGAEFTALKQLVEDKVAHFGPKSGFNR